MKKKLVALLAAAVFITGSIAGCGTSGNSSAGKSSSAKARTVSEIKKSGVIKIGVFSDKAPFGYVDSKGAYQGYDVYLAKQIAKDLAVKAEFTSLDPASRVEYAKTAKVDIVLANFTLTKERAEQVDFARPYMKVALGVVSPNKAVIKSTEDLKGKTLIVAKGTTAETYFGKNDTGATIQKYDAYADAYNVLLDGRGDAFSTDNTEVLAWARSNKGFTVGITNLGDTDYIAPAVQKGNISLLSWLNKEIQSLGKKKFFTKDYNATLKSVYGSSAKAEDIVVEGNVDVSNIKFK